MLNYELIEHSYKITTTHGGKLIGYFVPDVDGFYYFRPEEEKGYWNEHALLELGNKLKELNQDLYDELKTSEKKIMNNEKMNQIISDAWANYSKKVIANNLQLIPAIDLPKTQEEFINKCKTDSEFSEKWGLKIEERDVLNQVDQTNPVLIGNTALYPHKLITITYNNETIESHE